MSNKPESKSANWQKVTTYISLVLLGGSLSFAGNYLVGKTAPVSSQTKETKINPPKTNNNAPTIQSKLPITPETNFITNVVDQVGPAVVRINSSRTVKSEFPSDFPIPRRFGGLPFPQERERVESGTGSGFIINSNGQILTNAHVVAGADTVTVTLKDGRNLQGKVLGSDPLTDVAVIKVQGNNLPTISLGNSDNIKPGEWAIAIGNPLGLDNTVTAGIISGTGRSSSQVGVPDKRVAFIQTDAAINPGNSGGPLLNANGQVIGINTAIIRGAQGLGFSIPINTAQKIANQLIAKGKVEHPFLGIQMLTITPELKKRINNDPEGTITIDTDKGVLIAKVLPDSPARQGGLKVGDVIQKVQGQSIKDAADVQRIVENSQVGGNLPIEVIRNGKTLTVTIKPGTFPVKNEEP
ncbi:MAG TPA: HhoA/HhoB/HtrA family serine endopeptidase [Allocoleopsis sp.]